MNQYSSGLHGEEIAAEYLEEKGYRLLQTRYRGGDGEIDLIMLDGAFVVFIQVKYRPKAHHGAGFLAVTPSKQKRMLHAATQYLSEREQLSAPVRFDIVEITFDGVHHLTNAFQPGFW